MLLYLREVEHKQLAVLEMRTGAGLQYKDGLAFIIEQAGIVRGSYSTAFKCVGKRMAIIGRDNCLGAGLDLWKRIKYMQTIVRVDKSTAGFIVRFGCHGGVLGII